MKIFLLCLSLVGCSSIPKGLSDYERDSYIKMGEFDRVLKDMEVKKTYVSEKDLLLHQLNYAITLHFAGKYRQSNEVFKQCQNMIDWENKLPEMEEILGTVLSPNVKRFKLDEYEILTISLIKMLNALMLNEIDNALAESRQLERVGLFLAKNNKVDLLADTSFHSYFAGVLWESRRKIDWTAIDNAYINYKRAFIDHPNNRYLPFDLARVATLSGREHEVPNYIGTPRLQKEYPALIKSDAYKQSGELVVLFSFGLGARKVPDPDTNELFMKVLPRLSDMHGVEVIVDGTSWGEADTVLDLDELAKKNLTTRSNGFFGHIGKTTGLYMNHDTRNWDLLPKKFQMSRVMLPEGNHTVELKFVGDEGPMIKQINIKKGRKTFIRVHIPR